MTIDNSTGKDKEFYNLGKQMFDRIQPLKPIKPYSDIAKEYEIDQNGMTLRDYFAAKAMQGICSSRPGNLMTCARIAAEAYDLANAMLKARDSIWHNATPKEREA